jgi:hypothetical protein
LSAELDPLDQLAEGVATVAPVLERHRFTLDPIEREGFSMTAYARLEQTIDASFSRGMRRLQLSLGHRLAPVVYRVGPTALSHQQLMQVVLGDPHEAAYPPYSEDWRDGFRALARDLENHGGVFLEGSLLRWLRTYRAARS